MNQVGTSCRQKLYMLFSFVTELFGAGDQRAASRQRSRHAQSILAVLTAALPCFAAAQDVTTWHYDNNRSGVQANETILTPANIQASTFGKVFSFQVTGDVYAQPLYLSQYTMNDGQLHNVLIVATQRDNIYAFDADGKNPAQGYLWSRNLLGAGETWVSSNDVGTGDIAPDIGITGTPVLDRVGGTIYVVAKSKIISGTATFVQRLHALNIADGSEKLNGPTTIQATVNGTGEGQTTISFSPLRNNQRPALLLAATPSVGSGSSVIIAWSSHGDNPVYHGWVIAYDAANISSQLGAWADTPNGSQGGIWMSSGGPATDGNGNIFAAAGNGNFDVNTGGADYGDSAFRLVLGTSGFNVGDYFTPSDQSSLDSADNDMGTSALLMLPNQNGPLPHLAVTTDKSGTIYLVNRDKMGHYGTPNDTSVQNFSNGGYTIHNSFAFFNNALYEAPDGGPLQGWTFQPQTELFSTPAQSQSAVTFGCNGCDGGGSTPSVSANGTANGIVWALDNSTYGSGAAILHAYNPANLASEYYNSTQAANSRDTAAIAVKFTTPTIANGRVYVGGRNAVTVYGLLSASISPAATPTISPTSGTYTSAQSVTIADITSGASIYYTSDGSTPTTSSMLYAGPIRVLSSETIQAIAVASGYSQSAVASATYSINSSSGGQTEVSLSSVANAYGIYTDATTFSTGGFDGGGSAYSAAQLGSTVTFSGVSYALGAPNQLDVVRGGNSSVIPLSAGNFSSLKFLAAGVNGNQPSQGFTVTYTDGTTASFTQSVSDWYTPQNYPGEAIAVKTAYRNLSNGSRDSRSFDLFQYSFPLNVTKTVKSLSLPNNGNVLVVAVTLSSGQVEVSLGASANTYGIYTDGISFSTGGFDNDGNAYSAAQLGTSVMYSGVTYSLGAANQKDALRGTSTSVVFLPTGNYSTLRFLAAGVNGNQASQVFTVTYTDATTATFTQSLSDWFTPQHYPGESIAVTTSYRDTGSGGRDSRAFDVYQYSFALNNTKTTKSLTLPNNSNVVVLAITLQ